METGFIYAIGAAITWGLVYTIDQKILHTISPLTLLFAYSIFAALIITPFLFFESGSLKTLLTSQKTSLLLILCSAALTMLANFFILSGIKHLDASTASIIEIIYPFFVLLFSFIFFRSFPTVYFLVGGSLIFVGSVIIIKFA